VVGATANRSGIDQSGKTLTTCSGPSSKEEDEFPRLGIINPQQAVALLHPVLLLQLRPGQRLGRIGQLAGKTAIPGLLCRPRCL
jgi:hypothetical protein